MNISRIIIIAILGTTCVVVSGYEIDYFYKIRDSMDYIAEINFDYLSKKSLAVVILAFVFKYNTIFIVISLVLVCVGVSITSVILTTRWMKNTISYDKKNPPLPHRGYTNNYLTRSKTKYIRGDTKCIFNWGKCMLCRSHHVPCVQKVCRKCVG